MEAAPQPQDGNAYGVPGWGVPEIGYGLAAMERRVFGARALIPPLEWAPQQNWPMSTLPSGIVTFLFTDVEGSTRRWEAHGDIMKEAMARHDRIVRTSIESNDGAVFTTAGDEFCAAFSRPQQAVSAAVEIQL